MYSVLKRFTFLESHDLFGKTILPLCTHEGSGMGHSEADIKAVCSGAKIGRGLAITGSKVNKAEKTIENHRRMVFYGWAFEIGNLV